MSVLDRETVLEEEFRVQVINGTPYVCISRRFLEKAGHDPEDGDFPEELTLHYHDGGDRDGLLETDLKP